METAEGKSESPVSLGLQQQQQQQQQRKVLNSRGSMPNNSKLAIMVGFTVLCYAFLLPNTTAAFPQESTVGWIKTMARRKPIYDNNNSRQEIPSSRQQHRSCQSRLDSLQQQKQVKLVQSSSLTLLGMTRNRGDNNINDDGNNNNAHSSSGSDDSNNNNNNNNNDKNNERKQRLGKKEARKYRSSGGGGRGFGRAAGANTTTALLEAPRNNDVISSDREQEMLKRLTQLEHLVAKQTVEIRRLQEECRDLKQVSSAFAHVLELLRAAGLDTDKLPPATTSGASSSTKESLVNNDTPIVTDDDDDDEEEDDDDDEEKVVYEAFDDTEIFGEAPSSVTDAADAAGAAILAGLLGGKQRMLVDVRDSELSRDPETLVQFIELAILPVAAGLEGLRSNRNRVKIVFPTISQLLEYRRTMALAAPEVVALSTLGFDPVEERDNIVVIVAPPPDNEEGLQAMNELLEPPEWKTDSQIEQPVVVLNHHMIPVSGPAANFDVMYHLRLLSVRYMSGDRADDIFQPQFDGEELSTSSSSAKENSTADDMDKPDDVVLEAALKHAQEGGVNHGLTRAMVIRAYPKPWHVFVDISPATDADFVVAATFDDEPGIDEVNSAIVECLEGSEREDEIVAQQMQEALDMKNGELDILSRRDKDTRESNEEEEDEDDYDDFYDLWNEDSI